MQDSESKSGLRIKERENHKEDLMVIKPDLGFVNLSICSGFRRGKVSPSSPAKRDESRSLVDEGLLEAVKERVPIAEHRKCARHICANFMKRFKGQQFRKLFWYAATATTQENFEQHINEIKKLEPLAYDHLMKRDPKTWKIFLKVVPSGYQQFEVRFGYDAYVVDLGSRTRACSGWQLTGYPYVHAYACISSLNRDVENYVSPWFTTTMFLSCYRYTIKPLNVESEHEVEMESDIEVEMESDNEVDMEPDSEVDSFEGEDDIELEAEVPVQVRIEVQVEVPIQVQLEVQAEVPVPVQDEVEVEVLVQGQGVVQVQYEVPTFQVVVGRRIRKTSERITKNHIRKKWEGKEGSTSNNPYDLD
uniref:Zinc finger PMZ-type domain-containing protein n=1 Tax=Lactuca sativa TaxID=4236 RepID=A0A9R1V5Y3_LACSA|nr:hypothetical protein LSAT_V11C600310600 [Lactuca sativa]